MQINPNDRLYSLMLKSMQETLMPELQTGSAKAAAQMMCGVLNDLLKREHGTPALLRGVIAQGEALAREISAQLKIAAPAFAPLADNLSLSALLKAHGELTVRLTDLCEELAETTEDSATVSALLRKAAEWEVSYYQLQAKLAPPTLPRNPLQGAALTGTSLQAFLNHEQKGGGSIEVTHFEQLTGGFGKQTFLAKTKQGKTERSLVVRKADPRPIMQFGACNLLSEYDLLRALPADYPAPKPQLYCTDFGGIDAPYYTMDRIAGAAAGSYLTGISGTVDESLFLELARRLAQLHQLPLAHFGDYIRKHDDTRILDGTVADCYRYNLEGWRRYMREHKHLASPYLVWLLDWLQVNVPKDMRKPVLVHGDFNIHNILVQEGKLTAVLDWECAGFGSPEQDLAYIQPHITKHIAWDKFVAEYRKHGGAELNESGMKFGSVYATVRTALAGNRGSANLQSGACEDLRYVMVELGFMEAFLGMGLQASA